MTRDLRLLYAYRIVSRLYFHLPVLLVFFLLEDFSIFAAEVLLAVYGLAVTVGSALAPRLRGGLPRKWLVAGGEVLKLVGLLLVVATGEVWAAAIGQAVNGLGYAITQMTDASLLAAVAPSKEANARAQSGTQSYMFLAVLVAGVVGAVMFDADRESVFYASMGAALLSALIAAAVREPREEPAAAGGAAAARGVGDLTPDEAWWVRYYVTLRAVTLAVFVGFLPYLFFVIIEVSLAWFGVVLGIFSLAAFLGARYAVGLMDRFGKPPLTLATLLLSIGSMAVFATEPPLGVALVAMLLFGLSAGGVRPLTMSGLGGRRGELVPAMERRFGLVNAAILVAGGALLDGTDDFQTLMIVLTVAYATALAAFLVRPSGVPVLREVRR
ncbi:MAG TPA: MFS transporter [Solirubrobacteraceae bacterium]|jgi:MFS family permease|nr:MFS transporter [Solirubrobacteraceae bacterium]